ncbi:MAG: hypothetical protein J6K29_07840 [Clostridia bacterium]|nr:hypothetical protein [Clostridia bacterium]
MMNEYMGDTAERSTVQLPLPVQYLTAEVAGDFTLPDYQPEIKRLLRIGVNLLPPEPYSGGSEIAGSMDYYVLYIGQEGGVYCAPLSTEYRLEVRNEGEGVVASMGEPSVCLCDLSSEVPIGRVLAPRRLNIRCKIKARVGMYGESPLSTVSEENDPTVEALTAEATAGRVFRGMGQLTALQDDVILPPADGEMRVVCAEGQVMVTEATPALGLVNCRGEVTVKLTLTPAETMAEFASDVPPEPRAPKLTVLRRKIPFSISVETEGVTPACTATACGYCTEISVEMEEGQLHVETGVSVEARAQKNETVTFVKDLYSTRREVACLYATYPAEKALRALNGNFTLSDSLPLSEVGIHPAATVADITATALPDALTADPAKGRCVLTGTCRCHLLLLRDGEFTTAEPVIPFRYEFDDPSLLQASDGTLPVAFDGGVTVINCRARMDGERMGIDAELSVAVRTHTPAPFTALTDTEFKNEVTRRQGEYIICFPAPTDSVWSVAKRYHAPMAALTAANNLPAGTQADGKESLEGVGYLIV